MTQARNIGAMRYEIDLHMPVRTSDGGGGWSETRPRLASVSASIEVASSREVYQASQLQMFITHVVVIRYRNDIKQGGTIKLGSQEFYIERALDKENRGRWLTLWVREGGAT